MGWQVALSEAADADLEAVVAFIAKKSPAAAERIGLELVDLIFNLDQLPTAGARSCGTGRACASSRTAII